MIHLLPSIISDLENRLMKYTKDNPTEKELSLINKQKKLITQLSDIYKDYEDFTMYDTFRQVQDEINKLNVDELDGLFIKVYLKENADLGRFAFIDCYV